MSYTKKPSLKLLIINGRRYLETLHQNPTLSGSEIGARLNQYLLRLAQGDAAGRMIAYHLIMNGRDG